MIYRKYILLFIGILMGNALPVLAQDKKPVAFKVIPLGIRGGLDESNLSAYLVAAGGSNDYICLDAGTLHAGLEKAIKNKLFTGYVDEVLRRNIKGYCISHGHLDHLSGLMLNAPNDTSKYIYALPSVIKILSEKYFTWQNWANFTNEGEKPNLGKYKYQYLKEGQETDLINTPLKVKAYSLSHGPHYESTAFLIHHEGNYLLYLGDTGSDETEKSDKLNLLWKAMGPLVKDGSLKALFIEVSYPEEVSNTALFGHFKPSLFMKEMNIFNEYSEGTLNKIKIYITHRKPCQDCEERIKTQLEAQNRLKLQLVFPKQGVLSKLY